MLQAPPPHPPPTTMRVYIVLLLVLAVSARAVVDCGPENLASGWAPINVEVVKQVENLTAVIVAE